MLKNNQLLADTMRKAAAIRRKASGGRRSDDASSSDNTSSCSSSSKNHTSSSKVSSTAPPLPPPPPTHITNSQGRKATPDEMALTAKNYRLAKELSELRVRHREECKNVTRLTMENMNLASRCREAIGQVAALKKELALVKQNQQQQQPQPLAKTKARVNGVKAAYSRSASAPMPLSLVSSSSGSGTTTETTHTVLTDEWSPRLSPASLPDNHNNNDDDDAPLKQTLSSSSSPHNHSMTTTASSTPSPRSNHSPTTGTSSAATTRLMESESSSSSSRRRQLDHIMSVPVAVPATAAAVVVVGSYDDDDDDKNGYRARPPLLQATLVSGQEQQPQQQPPHVQDPPLPKATLVCSDDYDEEVDDSEDEDAFVVSSNDEDVLHHLMTSHSSTSKECKEDWPASSSKGEAVDAIFPLTASPKLVHPRNNHHNYNEEFPADITAGGRTILRPVTTTTRVDLDDDQSNDDDSNGHPSPSSSSLVPSHLLAPFDRLGRKQDKSTLSSIDAFEASFNTDFPESFSPKEDEQNHDDQGGTKSKAEIYNPFLSSPTKKVFGGNGLSSISIRPNWVCQRVSADPPGMDKTSPKERERATKSRTSPVSISNVMSKLSPFGNSNNRSQSPSLSKMMQRTMQHQSMVDDESIERTRQELFAPSSNQVAGMHEYDYAPPTVCMEGYSPPPLASDAYEQLPRGEGDLNEKFETSMLDSTMEVFVATASTTLTITPTKHEITANAKGYVRDDADDDDDLEGYIPATPQASPTVDVSFKKTPEPGYQTPPSATSNHPPSVLVSVTEPKRPEKTGFDQARARYEKALAGRHSLARRSTGKSDSNLTEPVEDEVSRRPASSTSARSLTHGESRDQTSLRTPVDEIVRKASSGSTQSTSSSGAEAHGDYSADAVPSYIRARHYAGTFTSTTTTARTTTASLPKSKSWRDSIHYSDPELDDGDIPLRSNLSSISHGQSDVYTSSLRIQPSLSRDSNFSAASSDNDGSINGGRTSTRSTRVHPWERKSSDEDLGVSRVRDSGSHDDDDDVHLGIHDTADFNLLSTGKQLYHSSTSSLGHFRSAAALCATSQEPPPPQQTLVVLPSSSVTRGSTGSYRDEVHRYSGR